jgi:hypothetical protein
MDPVEQAWEALTLDRKALDAAIIAVEERGYAHFGGEIEAAIRAYLASISPSTPVDGVGAEPLVKPLEWHDTRAPTPFGDYAVERDEDREMGEFSWVCAAPDDIIGHFPTSVTAKAAAQADYERRILSALASPEAEARLRERVAEGMRTFALSATVSKSVPGGSVNSSMVGYRRCNTEDEARGSFIRSVEKEKPDFSIDQLLCIEIPAEARLRGRVFDEDRLVFIQAWVGRLGLYPTPRVIEAVLAAAEARLAQAEGGPAVTEAMALLDVLKMHKRGILHSLSRRETEELQSAMHSLEAALHPQSAAGEEGK